MLDILQTLMNPHGHLRESLVLSWVQAGKPRLREVQTLDLGHTGLGHTEGSEEMLVNCVPRSDPKVGFLLPSLLPGE